MFHKLFNALKFCIPKQREPFSKFNAGILSFGSVCHMTYAYSTREISEIQIKSKYQIYSNGMTHFAVNTTNNKQFLIPSSLWYMQFDITEKWNALESNEIYKVTTYGYRKTDIRFIS